MATKMDKSIIGVVENMSAFIPPDQPERRYPLFGEGGGQQLAAEFDSTLLAQIPLEMPVLSGGDQGRPIVVSQPDSASAQAFVVLADAVASRLTVSH